MQSLHSIVIRQPQPVRSQRIRRMMRRLRRGAWIYVVAVVVLVVVELAGALVTRAVDGEIRVREGELLASSVENSHQRLLLVQQDRLRAAEQVASSPRVRELVRERIYGTPSARRDVSLISELRRLIGMTVSVRGFEGFMILGRDGAVLVADGATAALPGHHPLLDEPEVLARAWGGQSLMTLPNLPCAEPGTCNGVRSFYVVAPIASTQGGVDALLVCSLSGARHFDQVLQQMKLGETGELLAVDRQGRLLSESARHDRFIEADLLTYQGANTSGLPLVELGTGEPTRLATSVMAGGHGQSVGGYTNHLGRRVIGAWQWSDELQMGVGLEMEEAEGFAVLRYLWLETGAGMLLGALVVTGMLLSFRWGRRRMEDGRRRLLENRQRLKDIIEHMHAGTSLKGLDGRYWLVNRRFSEMFDLKGDGWDCVRGRTDAEVLPSALASEQRERDRVVIDSQRRIQYEEVLANRRKVSKYAVNKFPLIDLSGDVYAVCTMYTDITWLSIVEDELRDLNEKLELRVAQRTREAEEASRAKSEFLARMSHEIRTPMNAILGFTHLMQRTPLNDLQRDYVSRTQTSSQSLLSLINQILDFSKIEAGEMKLERIPFDLDVVLQEVGGMMQSAADAKGIELVFQVDPSTPWTLLGDPMRLRQVLTNLVGNAVKFTAHGHVMVRVEAHDLDADTIELRSVVSDTGIGISADKAAMIFEPFTQADGSTTRQFGGTGLGLAISRQLVELMGGQIEAAPRPEGGSLFTFTILVGRDLRAIRHEITDKVAARRALIVDDCAWWRDSIKGELESLRMEVIAVESGAEALEVLVSGPRMDVVLMDWAMPGMDGIETIRRIQRLVIDGRLPHLPTIFMVTAHGRAELEEELERVSVDAFLNKPVVRTELRSALCRALGGASPDSPVVGAHSERLAGRVLLVEDNAINQMVAQALLSQAGLTVDVASDGVECLERFDPAAHDVILMDVQMPRMDGHDATRRLRLRHGASVPIIAMTADVFSGDQDKCRRSGMDDFIGKPIDPAVLLATLGRWLPAGGASAVLQVASGAPAPREVLAFDPSAALGRVGGQAGVLTSLLRRFTVDVQPMMATLKQALADVAWAEGCRVAHNLKGIAGNLALDRVAAQSRALEQSLKAERMPEATSAFAELERAVAEAVGLVSVYCESESSPVAVSEVADAEADAASLVAALDSLRERLARSEFIPMDDVRELRGAAMGIVRSEFFDALEDQVVNFKYGDAIKAIHTICGAF